AQTGGEQRRRHRSNHGLTRAARMPRKTQSRSQPRIVLETESGSHEDCGSHRFPARFLKIPMMGGQGMKDVRREAVGRGHFVGRARQLATDQAPQVQVTLSPDLLNHLRTEARSRHVSLRWLVTGLVCDTMKPEVAERSDAGNGFC